MSSRGPTEAQFEEYATAMRAGGWTPNHFVALPYWRAAGWRVERAGAAVRVVDRSGLDMLPPLLPDGRAARTSGVMVDFEGYQPVGHGLLPVRFDLEFIYEPVVFADLSGGDWRPFRKAVNRFAELHATAVYGTIGQDTFRRAFLAWLEESGRAAIHDLKAIWNYAKQPGVRLDGLRIGDEVVAVNASDGNWACVNFRYSFARRSYKYASDYARWQFYLGQIGDGRPVNDGGCLGDCGLERYKRKLNPLDVRERFTWAGEG